MYKKPVHHNNLIENIYLIKESFLISLVYHLILSITLSSFCFAEQIEKKESSTKWVGTWSTAPQLVEPGNNPPAPGLSNNTIRQIVHVSIGGDSLRMRFTNEFSSSSVTMHSVHIAVSSGSSSIDTTTDKVLLFNGNEEVTIAAGTAIMSDPFPFELHPLSNVAITIYFGSTPSDVTGHPGSRTTSYILTGNQVAKADFSGSITTDHWYIINTIEVLAPDSAYAVAILGNSITDGRGSGTNKQNRWPDELSRRFQDYSHTKLISVLNEGIGGNAVLNGGLGPTALNRFERDVLNQNGVKWLIILEGINDIGGGGAGVGNNLINAYKQMIQSAHKKGIFVYGATLLPMKGSSYFSATHEAERQIVNEWIRNGGYFDAVIDFDFALRNPVDTLSLLPSADTGDHLHPNETGHRMMAEAVDLNLFNPKDTLVYIDNSKSVYFEPECAVVGSSWDILNDTQASNGKYVVVKPGLQSLNSAPSGNENLIVITFSLDTAGSYSVFARLNCPSANDDSYWVKMDTGEFQMFNGLGTSGWEWKKFTDYNLGDGDHTLTIAYREDGAKLDKICITNSVYAPTGLGDEAVNICTSTGQIDLFNTPNGYTLSQNFPNPFNPNTKIYFSLPKDNFVSLKVYDTLGHEIQTLIKEDKSAGNYEVNFDAANLSSGIYYYKLIVDNFIDVKKMILLK